MMRLHLILTQAMDNNYETHLIFIIATPEYNTGVVSKATDHMLHFLFHIGKEVLDHKTSIKFSYMLWLRSSSHKVSGIEGISKHKLLPYHDPHFITQVVKPVWLVEPSSPNKLSRYFESCYSTQHTTRRYNVPNSDHVVIAINS